jgi:hypothetical protein
MNSWLPGAFGVGTIVLLIMAFLGWVGTRRLLLSPQPSRPLAAVADGWRAVFRLIRMLPLVAFIGFVVKFAQILTYSARDLWLGPSIAARIWTGVAIEFIFTLAWAAVAFQIYLLVLAPELPKSEARERTPRAILYAFAFWAVTFALTIGGILWIATLHGRGRPIVAGLVIYMPYIFIIASALTRPGIAVGLPKPFKECRRIVKENWFGIAVTLALASLPLGLLYLAVGLARQFLHMSVTWALLLELPIALISVLFYAAFEGAIAQMYKRIA